MAHRLESPELPRDAQTLMLQRQEANSRFLTECYLFPAALRSGPCPKMRRIDFSGSGASWSGLRIWRQRSLPLSRKFCCNKELNWPGAPRRWRATARPAGLTNAGGQFACRRKKAGMSS